MVRTVFWRWIAVGGLVALLFITAQAAATQGIAGLLQVGESSALRPVIEDQLGKIPLAPGPGHDGQIYYAIALDLDGDEMAPLLDHGAYRYRRILYPLLASGFGLLEGEPLLYGMIVIAVAAMAVATGLTASFAVAHGRSEWNALVVLLNPGVWLSVRLLTADVLAMALMTAGLCWLATGTRLPAVSFALSALAKDVFLATPLPLGLKTDHSRWPLAVVPTAVLVLWMTWLSFSIGDGFAPRGNLTWPFKGIIDAGSNWSRLGAEEWVYLMFALGSVMAGAFYSFRRSGLRWPIAAWTTLAIVSSNWLWDFGNNAARAFGPIIVLIAWSTVQAAGSGLDAISPAREEGV